MRRYAIGLLALALAGYAATGMVQVLPGERGVVRRFGRVLEHKPEPGLWVGLPWGMDRVDRVPVDRFQSVTVGYRDDAGDGATPAGQLLTGDHNLVNVQATLYYKVRADEVEHYVEAADRVDGLLERAAETALAQWVGSRDVDDVLLNGKTRLAPALVEGTQREVEPYRLGVQLLDAQVALVAPPDAVKYDFDRVAQQQAKNEQRYNQEQQQADTALRTAQAHAYRVGQEAAAYAEGQRLLARQDADRFLARLRQYEAGRRNNPDYLRQIWEEERGKLLAKLKENGQIGLLDHHLGADGLDMTIAPAAPKKP